MWTEPRRYGRGLFLVTVAGGLTSLAWGRGLWSHVSSAVPSVPLVPSGWRIYTVAATMPTFDPATWKLEVGGLVEQPTTAELRRAARAAPHAEVATSTASPAGRCRTCAGRASASRTCSTASSRGARARRPVHERRDPVRRLADAPAGIAPRRAVGLRDERSAAAARHGAPVRLVMPEMYGYKNVKWVRGSTSSTRPRTATGRTSATTATPGSAGRTAMTERACSPLLAQRAPAALGERALLPLPARDRARPLPAAPLGARRPAAAAEGSPLLGRHRLGLRARARRAARRPARPCAHVARARDARATTASTSARR